MNPERFRRIEELYHAAREGTPEQRAALLAQTDPELRREVESLLSQSGGGEFLDRPAFGNAPEILEDATVTRLRSGVCLGPYRIESKLGEGGMGEVFRAIDTRLGRSVAIKVTREQFNDRFEREARAIASLNHPNICTLYDVGPSYLVMELVEGDTMAALLKSGPLPLKTALPYAMQILAALGEAHGKSIVHRDLKPANIMIAKSGIKVMDFGLAKSGRDHSVTATGIVLGTPAYMAPEQREGQPADARSDIYSFGCVLYEMVTGARVGSQRRSIPSKKLERIVSRCLEEDPDRRWQSVAGLEQELAGLAAGSRTKRLLAAGVCSLALFALAYSYWNRTPKLTDKDTIVLADFVNNTVDPVFDGTLRQGLAVQLEQSPFLKIMDDGQVQRVLRRMSLQPGARITNSIAHEICVREGAAATIDGTIASFGKSYVITLQAIACADGATLAREQIQAEDKEHVLSAVGVAAAAIRGKLGETRSSIQKLNRPLDQATTRSLEALKSYGEGRSELSQGHFLAAIPFFERAVSIDPNFALAHQRLGVAYDNAGDVRRSHECWNTAFRLIDRVSEYERSQITYTYYSATGELDKRIESVQSSTRTYPRFWGFFNGLSVTYIDIGQFEEGLKAALEASRLQPDVEQPYRRQLDAYLCMDRLSEARQLAEKLRALRIGGARIHQRFLQMAYVEDDQTAIAREIQWFAGKPEEYLSFGLQAAYRNVHGQRRDSHRLFQRATETARRRGLRDVAAEFEEADSLADALTGNCQTARGLGRPVLALALCGDEARVEKLVAEVSKLYPNGTIWNAVQLPGIRAAIALNRGRPAESVQLLESAAPYERAYFDAVYLRGLAYLRLNKGKEAVAEFRKVVDHKGANWASAWRHPHWAQFYSPSHLGMARGFALAGDQAEARKAFLDFFELWKDADPGLPILQQAKAEYSRIR